MRRGQHAGIDNNFRRCKNGTGLSTGVEIVIKDSENYNADKSQEIRRFHYLDLPFGRRRILYLEITKSCMYWTGDNYQTGPCDVKSGNTAVIALMNKNPVGFTILRATFTQRTNDLDSYHTITYKDADVHSKKELLGCIFREKLNLTEKNIEPPD